MEEKKFKQLFGKRIKELRVKNNLTQEKLAELIGVGERNLSKIECGNNFIKADTTCKLLNALNVQPEELFNFHNAKTNAEIKEILIKEISNETFDIKLLYKIYRAIKY